MGQLADMLIQTKHNTVIQAAQLAARNGNIDPNKVAVMDMQGNPISLAQAKVAQSPNLTARPGEGKTFSISAWKKGNPNADAEAAKAAAQAQGYNVQP
jgi:hypothetical protein